METQIALRADRALEPRRLCHALADDYQNAVPWDGVVNTVSSPAVTVTPRLNPRSLVRDLPLS